MAKRAGPLIWLALAGLAAVAAAVWLGFLAPAPATIESDPTLRAPPQAPAPMPQPSEVTR